MSKPHIEIAKQLKQNSVEIKEYFEDLYRWQSEIETKEEKEKKEEEKKKHINNYLKEKELGENDNTHLCNKNLKKNKKENKNISLKRDCNSIDSYYKAWDKLKMDDIENDSNDNDDNNVNNFNENTVNNIYNDINNIKCDDETNENNKKMKSINGTMNENDTNKNNSSHKIDGKNNVDANIDVDYEISVSKSLDNIKNEHIVKFQSKVYNIYFSKSEESKINYQNKKYNKCLENYNDIINYIDYELRNNNIFIEIEKNCDNETYIEIMSNNYIFDKKVEELLILRTKTLINRSLVFQKLSSYFESIQDCSSIILFYKYFLPNKKDCIEYSVKEFLSINIKYIIFKAYYLRGMARYKLKIYKLCLKDFTNSKELSNELYGCKSINIDNSIQHVENIIKENNIKKHIRRQNEYTSTMLEQYKLTPRLLKIEVIPKSSMRELKYFENNNEIDGNNEHNHISKIKENCISNTNKDNNTKGINEKLGKNENQVNEFIQNKSYDVNTLNKKSKDNNENNLKINEENVENKKNDVKLLNSEHINSDSSLELSEKPILSDIEDTKPLLLTLSNEKSCEKIKNKINFELLWNSNKIKKNLKSQIDILKIAFLVEGIFNFYLDKDVYVDILDSLFKNNFLDLFEDTKNDKEIKKHLEKKYEQDCSFIKMNTQNQEDLFKENEYSRKEKIKNTHDEKIDSNDYVILIDILYSMTNYGKDSYVFLFIDKKERILLQNFFSFILKYPNIFICSEECIKQKTLLMKNLLEIIY
ncbi:conserved Plasmodium protein, unknown function [Plasmodium gallinaceum]|uniref:Uncharacterized protein n=1 Tax=Plasmodium gallinaceum TaxID=5849 RepID=A0A1J1H2L0_PLAGA|nr:conserved Plasmodium protein, unknown function [Plasmodium gallinaceum]CRG97582.1 conserved Plasmodium protein, unknown function [Plasmodium gallinaceum]